MKFRTFGNSGVQASEVGFGVWTVSMPWWGIKDVEFGKKLLRKAYDLGITMFDTADTYGNGLGETILKDALGDVRSKITIATKFGYNFYDTKPEERKGQVELPHKFEPDFITFALEQSLQRLSTDHVDLWQMHNARMSHIQRDDLFALMEKFKQQGKVRAYGVALGPAIGWEEEGLEAMKTRTIDALMIIYNLLEQKPGRSFLPVARERHTGLQVRVPHSSGMLEGKYTKDTVFSADDHRSHRKKVWMEQGLVKVEALKFLTEGRGRTLAQAALQYILAHPEVTTTLPNIYNEEQLVEFAGATDTPAFTAEELAMVDKLFDENYGLPVDMSLEKVATA
jgi:aryl-alcohol dehydrogenase-like predicted oxidoreductase